MTETIAKAIERQEAFKAFQKNNLTDRQLDLVIEAVGVACDTIYGLGDRGIFLGAMQNQLSIAVDMRERRRQK